MALEIVESCVNCWACEPLCPSKAILAVKPHFLIDADKCTECLGDFAAPQCAAICPIEGAIVNELNEALNPPGSLTGIPPVRLAAAMAEIRAR
jgi:ferredoxin